MISVFVTRDEHVGFDRDGEEYRETDMWQVREDMHGGSEVIDCCLTYTQAMALAASVRKGG